MFEMAVTQFVRASPEQVFRQATAIEQWPTFLTGLSNVEVLEGGPMKVGTRFVETRKMFGKEASEEMEVTEFHPPTRYAVEAASCGCRYFTDHQFQPSDEGTMMTLRFRSEPQNILARLVSFLMTPMMKRTLEKCMRQDLLDLKTKIESTASTGSLA